MDFTDFKNSLSKEKVAFENVLRNAEIIRSEAEKSLKEIEIEPIANFSNISPTVSLKQETFSPITIFDLPKQNDYVNESVPMNISNDEPKQEIHKYQDISKLVDFKIIGELFNEFIVLERGESMYLMDFHIEGIALSNIRKAALSMRAGGVGYYPRSNFVHIDTGPARHW